MKTILIYPSMLGLIISLIISCTKQEDPTVIDTADVEFLQFEKSESGSTEGTILYSDWVKTEFSNSSIYGSEQWHLPHIPNELLNLEKDLVIIFAKRNHLFQLPMAAPTSNEYYTTDFGQYSKGVLGWIRVYAYDWETQPLNDIFFGVNTDAMFRVMIVPGQKLFDLSSKGTVIAFENMSYEEIAIKFNIPD